MIARACATMVALCTTGAALAASDGWTEDFAAAKKQAAEENKHLLINFTGSDWCGWCIKLKDEAFDHAAFKEGVADKFVLVELDYPRDKSKLSEATIEQNEKLKDKYVIQGYPTIIAADAEGKPYATTGYKPGGPEAYVKHLDELRENKATQQEALETARRAEGPEKAKGLMSFLQSTGLSDQMIASFYGDVVAEIKEADPEDESGFGKRTASKEQLSKFEQGLQGFAQNQDLDGALAFSNKTLEEGGMLPEDLQRVALTRTMIYAQQQKFDEAIASIDEAKALAPDSEFAPRLDGLKAQLANAKANAAGE
jgi:thioredoxin-related protein